MFRFQLPFLPNAFIRYRADDVGQWETRFGCRGLLIGHMLFYESSFPEPAATQRSSCCL